MSEGFDLMFIGMGGVFIFLLLLVGMMKLMGWFFTKYDHLFPEPEEEQKSSAPAASPMAKIAAAIAVAHSRSNNK